MSDYELVYGSTETLPAEARVNGQPAAEFQVQLVPYQTGEERVDPTGGWHAHPYQPNEQRGYYCVYTRVVEGGNTVISHSDRHVRIL